MLEITEYTKFLIGLLALVPLTMPLLAGPDECGNCLCSAIQLGYPLRCDHPMYYLFVSASLMLCFKFLPWFAEHLSKRSIVMSTRVMGLLLVAIAVEFIAGGIKGLFPQLAS